jgi:hypothetical protein
MKTLNPLGLMMVSSISDGHVCCVRLFRWSTAVKTISL